MKQYLMKGASALLLGGFLISCSHEETDLSTYVADKIKAYEQVFVEEFGSIDPNQDWGFGSATRGVTRAVMTETWNGVHENCKFDERVFDMAVPSDAVDLTKGSYTDAEKNATAFYIPSTFNGEMNFYSFNIPANAKIYNQGVVTGFNANANGLIVFYNINEMTYSISSGSRHTVINAGTLNVTNYANIGDVYNKGTLVLEREHSQWWANEGGTADIPNDMHIYSNGEGSVMMPDGGDLKAVCDIHGTLYVGNRDQNIVKNVKIQNSTKKYICGIDCTGKVENVDGPLETSYVKADVFSFDGNPIYLLPGGHVDVTTLQVPNSGSHFYGAANSTGLVEAVNYEFGNKNDFTHTFSNNIYFKVKGGYIMCDNCYAMGQSHFFNNVDEYLASNAHAENNQSDEYALAADRINTGDASGSPACGSAWSIGTGGNPPDQEREEKTLIESGRVFCEDLGQVTREDIDFNDVVFDAYIYEVKYYRNDVLERRDTICEITLLAAGGTLPLTVAGKEVHDQFGEGTGTIINTIVSDEGSYGNSWATKPSRGLGTFNYSRIIDIPIVVKYGNNTVQELEAGMGKVPRKICVPIGTPWTKERNKLKDAYPSFQDYVNNSTPGVWDNPVGTYLYSNGN